MQDRVRISETPRIPLALIGSIGAGTHVEHYEMAGYMTAISLAQRLGKKDVVDLLRASLGEEEAADKKLRSIGGGLLKSAPAAA